MCNSWKIIVAMGVFLCLPSSVWAAFNIDSRFSVREEYTDNFWLTAEDEESDFISRIDLGVGLHYQARLLELDFDYALSFLKTLDHSSEDETSISDIQRFLVTGLFFPGQDFTIQMEDRYERVVLDNRQQVDEDSYFVNKSNVNRLTINPEYRLRRFATFEPYVGYRFEKVSYKEPEGEDSDSHEVYLNLSKNLGSKATAFLGVSQQYYRGSFEGGDEDGVNGDYDSISLTGGFEYRITSGLTARVVGGEGWIDYKEQDKSQSQLWDIGLDYQPGKRWRMGLAYNEDYAISATRGVSRNKRFEATFDYLVKLPTTLVVYATKQDYELEDTEDRGLGGMLNISIPFSNRINLDFMGELEKVRFLPEDEKGWRYSAGLEANYRMRIMDVTAGYRYRVNDSDVDGNDYKSNILYVEAAFRYGQPR